MAPVEERPYGHDPTGSEAPDMKQWHIPPSLAGDAVMTAVTTPASGPGDVPHVSVEQLPIIVWTTDSVLTLTSSDGGQLEESTLGPDQIVGLTIFDLFETDDPRLPVISAHVRALGGQTVSFEMRLADRAFHGRVSPLKDREGEQIGTICAVVEDAATDPVVLATTAALVAVE
jgi:hypothetical protein